MNEEEVVRRHAHRSGFALVGYRRVAIPIFRATLRVLMLDKKPLPAIPEFILRAISVGIETPMEIANMLGLDQPIVNAGLRTLMQSDDVVIGGNTENRQHRVMFTSKGRQTLTSAHLIVPEEVDYQIDVDGLTRKTIPGLGPRAVRPVEVGKEGLAEISASPRSKPTFEQLNLLARNYHRTLQRDGKESYRDLLEVLSVDRVERLFRTDAILLFYKADNGKEIQVAFVIDEELSTDHETAFARLKKDSQRPILPEFLSEDPISNLASWIPDNIEVAASSEMTSRLRVEAEETHKEIRAITGRLDDTSSVSEKAALRTQLKTAEENLARLQLDLDNIKVHGVEVYEHRGYLEEAFRTAQQRLMIISPWIKAIAVNDWIINSLEAALERGVDVYIGYGLDGENDRETDRDRQVIARLERISKTTKHFHFLRFGDTHAKILVCDDWYISTSFNWLSFRGDPRLPFRDERGTYVRLPDVVNAMFQSYSERF